MPANVSSQETRVQSLDQKDPLKKEMATHSSILAWRIPWREEPGGLQSMRSRKRVRHSLEWCGCMGEYSVVSNSLQQQQKGIHLPMQGIEVQSLVSEGSTCHRATCAITPEPELQSLVVTTSAPTHCKKRSRHSEKPVRCSEDPVQPKTINKMQKRN